MKKTIKELAFYFDEELDKQLPIKVLPDGTLVYYSYIVKQLSNGSWGVFNIKTKDLKNQYYLKSCALIAAKAYHDHRFNKCSEIKDLDNNYWSNYVDSLIFKKNIKHASSERYPILVTRMEESNNQAEYFKNKIYSLFKLTFV